MNFGPTHDWHWNSRQRQKSPELVQSLLRRAAPYSPQRVAERHVWSAAKQVGLRERLGWRSFRRTYSSLLRQLGVDVKVQQELMRHADIRTTMDLYTDYLQRGLAHRA